MKGDPTGRSYNWITAYGKTTAKDSPDGKAYFSGYPEAARVEKGTPIVQAVNANGESVLNAFYLHRYIAAHYTPTAIEMSREAAIQYLRGNGEWKQFLEQRANGVI